jgi:hypothetical protein
MSEDRGGECGGRRRTPALGHIAGRSWGPIVTGTYAVFVVVLMGIATTG